jgi:hypothetical protein
VSSRADELSAGLESTPSGADTGQVPENQRAGFAISDGYTYDDEHQPGLEYPQAPEAPQAPQAPEEMDPSEFIVQAPDGTRADLDTVINQAGIEHGQLQDLRGQSYYNDLYSVETPEEARDAIAAVRANAPAVWEDAKTDPELGDRLVELLGGPDSPYFAEENESYWDDPDPDPDLYEEQLQDRAFIVFEQLDAQDKATAQLRDQLSADRLAAEKAAREAQAATAQTLRDHFGDVDQDTAVGRMQLLEQNRRLIQDPDVLQSWGDDLEHEAGANRQQFGFKQMEARAPEPAYAEDVLRNVLRLDETASGVEIVAALGSPAGSQEELATKLRILDAIGIEQAKMVETERWEKRNLLPSMRNGGAGSRDLADGFKTDAEREMERQLVADKPASIPWDKVVARVFGREQTKMRSAANVQAQSQHWGKDRSIEHGFSIGVPGQGERAISFGQAIARRDSRGRFVSR